MTAIISVDAMLLNEFLKEHRTVQEQQIKALKAQLKEQASQISKTQRPASTEQTGNADGLEQPVKAGERYYSLKIARVLVRLDHGTGFNVNATHGIV